MEIAKHLYFSGEFKARFHGEKTLSLLSTGNQIENEIFWKGFDGSLEGLSYCVWAEVIKQTKPNAIWDIGANSGTFGLLAKSILPESSVSFFEPLPKAVSMIQQNLELNQFKANIFQLALGDYDGLGKIYLPEGIDFVYSVTVNQNTTPRQSKSKMVEIQIQTAEAIIRKNHLPSPNLIKIDVETFEPEVLKGFGKMFPKEAFFLIEVLGESNALKLREFFPNSSYNFYNIDDYHHRFRKTFEIEKSDAYNYLVVPKSRSAELNLGNFEGQVPRVVS